LCSLERGRHVIDHRALAEALAEFARSLLTDYSIWDVLQQLGERATELLPVAGAGVMVQGEDGKLRFASATDGRITLIETLQIELGEGPCLLAFQTGLPMLVPDLEQADPFPKFAKVALDHGMRAVFAFPMTVGNDQIGAFNLYRETPGVLDDEQIAASQDLGDAASAFVCNHRALDQATTLAGQLQYALDARVLVEQAKGMLAERLGVEPSDAFELMRGVARRAHRPVRDIARDILAGKFPVD